MDGKSGLQKTGNFNCRQPGVLIVADHRKEAQEEGCNLIIKEDMLNAIKYYFEKPCLESAITLIQQYPSFLPAFELTKNPLQKWAKEFKEKNQ